MSKVCVATDSHKALLVGNSTRVEALLKPSSRADMDARDTRGYTPFMVACAGGHVDVVRVLCAAGCDCTLRNDVGLVRNAQPSAHACTCLTPVCIAVVGAIASQFPRHHYENN
jgi:ankyrin repeat protein